jgi:hypothetical protein
MICQDCEYARGCYVGSTGLRCALDRVDVYPMMPCRCPERRERVAKRMAILESAVVHYDLSPEIIRQITEDKDLEYM